MLYKQIGLIDGLIFKSFGKRSFIWFGILFSQSIHLTLFELILFRFLSDIVLPVQPVIQLKTQAFRWISLACFTSTEISEDFYSLVPQRIINMNQIRLVELDFLVHCPTAKLIEGNFYLFHSPGPRLISWPYNSIIGKFIYFSSVIIISALNSI